MTLEDFLSFPNHKQPKQRFLSTPQDASSLFSAVQFPVRDTQQREESREADKPTHRVCLSYSTYFNIATQHKQINQELLHLVHGKIKLKEDLELRKLFSVEPVLVMTPYPSKKRFIFHHLGNGERLESNNFVLASGGKLGGFFLL